MPKITITVGILLILLGVGGYVVTGFQSWTAMIPAFFGLPITILGGVALKVSERARMHVMHATLLLALLGIIGSAKGVVQAAQLIGGADLERKPAIISKAIMAVICVTYLVLAIKSFIDARRAPKTEPQSD